MAMFGGIDGYRVKEGVEEGGVEEFGTNGMANETAQVGAQICYCTVDGQRCILGKYDQLNSGECNGQCIKWCTTHLVKGSRRAGASAGCFSHIETGTSSCSQLGYRVMQFAGGRGVYWTGHSWAHA
eukprot:TRINITY_DN825_c0_g1_i11.p1 TRINITY_DN825_c0_g1~~TRINITY_DN825_c0_g1_i11.p1  ORF type:complete len:145 (+),score=20.40 TRINITY_DN825_c0_g1_i11:58-435(+)